MEKLIVSLFVLFVSTAAFAVNSISVTVDGVTYSCTPGGGDSLDCDSKIAALQNKLNLCTSNGYGAMTCIDKVWPGFKTANPACVDEASTICLNLCTSNGYGAMTCLDKCQ